MNLITNHSQNKSSDSPLNNPLITASTKSVKVSVTAVPPTACLLYKSRLRLASNTELSVSLPTEKYSHIEVAPLLFIALIENAFKHGVSNTQPSFVHIDISVDDDRRRIICRIENSCFPKGIDDKSGSGIGLDNLKKRLDILLSLIHISKPEYNGHTVGSLRLRMGYRLNATRLNRAGVDLLVTPNLELQMGDRLTVVGRQEDIARLASRLGNSMKRLNEPNMITIFIGIFLGILLGSIPLSIPGMSSSMKLGLAGGPLVVAILIGRFGHKMKLVTYTSTSALSLIHICFLHRK